MRNLKAQSSQSQSSRLPSQSSPLQSQSSRLPSQSSPLQSQSSQQSSTIRGLSVSPEPLGGYSQRPRRTLEKINKEQYKSFRVLQTFQIRIYLLPIELHVITFYFHKLRMKSCKFFPVLIAL